DPPWSRTSYPARSRPAVPPRSRQARVRTRGGGTALRTYACLLLRSFGRDTPRAPRYTSSAFDAPRRRRCLDLLVPAVGDPAGRADRVPRPGAGPLQARRRWDEPRESQRCVDDGVDRDEAARAWNKAEWRTSLGSGIPASIVISVPLSRAVDHSTAGFA